MTYILNLLSDMASTSHDRFKPNLYTSYILTISHSIKKKKSSRNLRVFCESVIVSTLAK